jgi:hypothetical protein
MGAGDAGTVRVQLPQLPPGAARALKRQRSPGTRRPDSGAVRPVRPRPAARAAAAAACARGLAERRRAGLEPALRAPAAVCRAERGGRRCLHQPVRSARRPAVPGDQGRRGAQRMPAERAAGQVLPVASAREHGAAGAGTAWARGEGAGGRMRARRRGRHGEMTAGRLRPACRLCPVPLLRCGPDHVRVETVAPRSRLLTARRSHTEPARLGSGGAGRPALDRPGQTARNTMGQTDDRRTPQRQAGGSKVDGPGRPVLGRAKVGRAGPARNRNESGRAGPGQVTRASPRTRR